MTILQLKVVVAIYELGSISGAAENLNISQPNASSYLKSLEKEIGFSIFTRSKSGTILTEKGLLFLERAKRIIFEQNQIFDIQNHSDMYRLRLGSVNYLSAAEPLITLCQQHCDDPEADFRCFNVSIDEGIDELDKYNLDIVFSPARKSQVAGIINACKKKNLTMISLGEVPAVIHVRKNHPAIAEGKCINIMQGSDAMKEYPYVAYRNLGADSKFTGYNDTHFVQSKYVIYVDEVTVRLRLVASTNAFSFGITPSKNVNERYGLVSFPVSGVFLEAFCIIRKSDEGKKEINEYISLLKEELNIVNKSS